MVTVDINMWGDREKERSLQSKWWWQLNKQPKKKELFRTSGCTFLFRAHPKNKVWVWNYHTNRNYVDDDDDMHCLPLARFKYINVYFRNGRVNVCNLQHHQWAPTMWTTLIKVNIPKLAQIICRCRAKIMLVFEYTCHRDRW